ncbi:G2/mitotic-specific cyclin-A-like [Ptychodera flava]|uniref:G2/mitotic-specific cyclin-A-like n=1 Tax=Ptychodera flava TaxID=63121 RepID=UPI00396A5BBD
MSYFSGSSTSTSGIVTNTTSGFENQIPGIRKTKRDDGQTLSTAPQANKRAALGTITSNSTRVQPFRAAKATSSEGFFSTVQTEKSSGAGKSGFVVPGTAVSQQGFSIHIDSDEHSATRGADHVDGLQLNPTVTSLINRDNISLRPEVFSLDESSGETPMVLDTSSDQTCETSRVIEIDGPDEREIFIPEYAKDIFEYLKEAETRHKPKATYMKKQPDITCSMRCILVDWLVEVAEEYKLHNETLYLAINYIDRFLSAMSVLRSKLQLVGAASMFLAAKFEEIYPPEVGEFVYITDDTYTKKQVLRMEHLILKVLSFDLAIPTINVFLNRFLRAAQADGKTEQLARFLAELTLQEYDPYIRYLPSLIAASAVCLANHTLNQQHWTPTLEHYSGFSYPEIYQCVKDLQNTFINSVNHPQQAVREKYKSPKLLQVSLIQPPQSIPPPL